MKSSWGLTIAGTLTVCANKDVQAHEGQQRPLQFGAGSVKHHGEGTAIAHMKLVSRQNITDAQKGLEKKKWQKKKNYKEKWVNIWSLSNLHLLSDTEVSVGETTMSPLTEQTQL